MVNKPFILGSNLVTSDLDLCDYETFMRTVAGNTGNSYISYALIREICGRYRNVPQIKSLYAYDFSQMDRDVDVVNNECTHLCLVLQDQIRIHKSYGYQLPYRNIIRFLRKVRRPIVVAGLGANSLTGYDPAFDKKLPQDLIRFLRELAGLVHAIGVRGEFTREVLAKIGVRNAVTIGCPSYFEKGPVRQVVKRGFGRLGVSTGVSPNLLANAQVYLQDCQPVEAEIIKALAFGRKRDFSPDVYAALVDGRMHIFSSIEDWQKSLAALDFFVGLRVHGAICALNSGVPAVVMNRDSRAREMCEYLGIPYLPELSDTNKVEEIYAQADYARMNDAYAARYAAFREFMRGNGLELAALQADEPADRQPSLQIPGGGYPRGRCTDDGRTLAEVSTGKVDGQERSPADGVVEMLKSAKRPLVVAGQGVRLSKADSALLTFVERYGVPVITTRLGIDLVNSDHPLYVGRPGNYGERAANLAAQTADLILSVGSRLSTASIGHDSKKFGIRAKKIVVDIDRKELDKPICPIDVKICDDAALFLYELNGRDFVADYSRWSDLCRAWKEKYPVVIPEYKMAEEINSYYFTDRLSELTDDKTMVVVDTGSCFHVACQAWKIKRGQHFLTTGGLSSMGWWVAGIGACIANNRRNTVVITGDGSLQMNIQEFATIRHNKLPIKTFVFNNNGYLLIRHTQRNFMEGRLFGEGPKSGVWCPECMKIAEAYGIKGVKIDRKEDIDVKIREVLAYDGPVICEVKVPEWQLLMPRVSSEKKSDGTLVSRDFEDMYPFLPADELAAQIDAAEDIR